jgi:calcineurin-like phosphoesterase family protein
MSGRLFVIGDTHFGHRKIIGFEAEHRPFATIEEHDDALVDRWNAVVRQRDTVWHLGDVLFGRDAFSTLGRLNGAKKLVGGNHDQYPTALYLQHFNRVVGAAEVKGCILTHIPVHDSQFHRYALNIHGHLHSKSLPDRRYRCVSAEHYGLAPVELDRVIAES